MKRVMLGLAAFVLTVGAFAIAQAQTYPARPVRVIVPYPPGETGDTLSRLIGQKMSERLGQQLIVDNRAGASGQIGLGIAARAPADGYTIAVGQAGNVAVAPHTYKSLPYDPLKDFVPVALFATNYLALVVHPSVPYKSVAEMIAWAKANPGRLRFASNGEGGFPHLSFELLRMSAGFAYLHVPYKGAAQIVSDLLGGQVDAAMASYTSMAPHAKAGKLRLLGITNPSRMSIAPEVPTVADAVPGYSSRGWFGFLAPAGTPRDVIVRLNRETNAAMQIPEIRDKMIELGLVPAAEGPEAFGELIRSDYIKFQKVTREIGFKPQ